MVADTGIARATGSIRAILQWLDVHGGDDVAFAS
jgi:hypothetical protein